MPEDSSDFDVIVIGAGTGGEVAAQRLNGAGMRVAVIERELIGGECAYWACIPSKTLIHPTAVIERARKAPGVEMPDALWREIAAYRDEAIQHLDDHEQVQSFRDAGITFLRGEARIVAHGIVEVAEQRLTAPRLIVATGSDPRTPPIEGLETAGYWTNREATTFSEVPESVVIVGGSAQAVELAQMLRRYGADVAIVHRGPRLLTREEPEVGQHLADRLTADGITLRLERKAVRVTRSADGMRAVSLDDGSQLRSQQVILATGRTPRTQRLGLESTGATITRHGVQVDAYCRAAPGVWAVGDVTGVALFTHVAQYQARIASDDILGRNHPADYRAIPRVIFSDPEIGTTGLTTEEAHQQGLNMATASIELRQTIAAPITYGKDVNGWLGLIADQQRGVLIGAWTIGPHASEWIHLAVLAIRAETPIAILRDVIEQFPTFSEAYHFALDALDV